MTCEPCNKYIKLGQSILECEVCFTAIHTKCYKKARFCSMNGTWTCTECASNVIPRYNPFPCSTADKNDSSKFYDDEGAEDDITIQAISNVLNSCKPYSILDLNTCTQQQHIFNKANATNTTQFSSYFLNIDGLKTNFNTVCVELKRIKHEFSVIGFAETNVEPELKDLFNLPGYSSFYQSTMSGKHKGTGVALYVSENFNASVLEEVSFCNADIEALFVQLTQPSTTKVLTIGIIYRPPSGSVENFFHYSMIYIIFATSILYRLSCSLISTIATLHLLAFALVALATPVSTQHDIGLYLHSGYDDFAISRLRNTGRYESPSSAAPLSPPLDARKPTNTPSYVTARTLVNRNSNIRYNETNSLDSTLMRVCTNLLSLNPLSRTDKHRHWDHSRTFDDST